MHPPVVYNMYKSKDILTFNRTFKLLITAAQSGFDPKQIKKVESGSSMKVWWPTELSWAHLLQAQGGGSVHGEALCCHVSVLVGSTHVSAINFLNMTPPTPPLQPHPTASHRKLDHVTLAAPLCCHGDVSSSSPCFLLIILLSVFGGTQKGGRCWAFCLVSNQCWMLTPKQDWPAFLITAAIWSSRTGHLLQSLSPMRHLKLVWSRDEARVTLFHKIYRWWWRHGTDRSSEIMILSVVFVEKSPAFSFSLDYIKLYLI